MIKLEVGEMVSGDEIRERRAESVLSEGRNRAERWDRIGEYNVCWWGVEFFKLRAQQVDIPEETNKL